MACGKDLVYHILPPLACYFVAADRQDLVSLFFAIWLVDFETRPEGQKKELN